MEEKRIEDEEPEKQKKRTKSERIKSTNRGVFVLFYKMKPNNYKSIRFSRLKGWSGLISMFFLNSVEYTLYYKQCGVYTIL